jgi:hypothetical protein
MITNEQYLSIPEGSLSPSLTVREIEDKKRHITTPASTYKVFTELISLIIVDRTFVTKF